MGPLQRQYQHLQVKATWTKMHSWSSTTWLLLQANTYTMGMCSQCVHHHGWFQQKSRVIRVRGSCAKQQFYLMHINKSNFSKVGSNATYSYSMTVAWTAFGHLMTFWACRGVLKIGGEGYLAYSWTSFETWELEGRAIWLIAYSWSSFETKSPV